MNMKKVLAAVLAVMMAVSAMAITAFAADTTIEMGVRAESTKGTGTLTWTIPVSNQYGYLTEGNKITLTLPKNPFLNNWWTGASNITWTVNGYKLGGADMLKEFAPNAFPADTDVWTAVVNVGVVGHDYIEALGYTTIPQDGLVLGTETLTIAVSLDFTQNMWALGNFSDGLKAATSFTVETASGYTQVVPYAAWGEPVRTHSDALNLGNIAFVDSLYNNAATDTNNADVKFEWDHTLANKAAILGAESAKVVVTLAKPVSGVATYTLWAKNDEAYVDTTVNDWLDFEATRKAVATVNVNGTTSELVFDVPLEVLYDATYGTWNTAFAITEDITNIYNVMLVENGVVTKYVDPALVSNITKNGAGTLGELSWTTRYDGKLIATYMGTEVNYAADALATSVALVLTSADEVIEEVVDPVEPSTEEEEDDTVVTPEEPEEEDTNPETGLALALVPMMVAAVAVVASKRR